MRTYPDARMGRLLGLVTEARQASEADDHAGAVRTYRELARQLEAMSLRSGWVHWALAVTHDTLEDFPMAMTAIRTALTLDPLNPGCRKSFDIIAGRIRSHLLELPVEDPSIPQLHGLVQQSGDADVLTHLVLARHYAATSRPEKAQALLEALCLLAPASRDLWAERAAIARRQGDLAAAANFEAEAQARALADVPYGIPSRGEG
jgi:tetratricopeptide (TPR) repeat protein